MKRYVLILTVLFAVSIAHAEIITIAITGTVTEATNIEVDLPDGAISIGDTFTGTYTYDSSAIDSSSSSTLADYRFDSPCGFDISLGGFKFKTSESHTNGFRNMIYNDHSPSYTIPIYDGYSISSSQNEPLSTGLNVNQIRWDLHDTTHAAISSTDLTTEAPDLTAWTRNEFFIGCGSPNGGPVIRGTVTEAVVVPEPGTMCLVGLGGILLRRRKK